MTIRPFFTSTKASSIVEIGIFVENPFYAVVHTAPTGSLGSKAAGLKKKRKAFPQNRPIISRIKK
jgi:hypothetical protein